MENEAAIGFFQWYSIRSRIPLKPISFDRNQSFSPSPYNVLLFFAFHFEKETSYDHLLVRSFMPSSIFSPINSFMGSLAPQSHAPFCPSHAFFNGHCTGGKKFNTSGYSMHLSQYAILVVPPPTPCIQNQIPLFQGLLEQSQSAYGPA
jgi:hypothetical protein